MRDLVPVLLGLHMSEVEGQETNNDSILCQTVIRGVEKKPRMGKDDGILERLVRKGSPKLVALEEREQG